MSAKGFNWVRSNASRRELAAWHYVLVFSLCNSLLFQWPLCAHAASTRASFDLRAAIDITTLFMFQLMVSTTLLGLCALVSIRLLKGVCAVPTGVQLALPLVLGDKVGLVQLLYVAVSTTVVTHGLKLH